MFGKLQKKHFYRHWTSKDYGYCFVQKHGIETKGRSSFNSSSIQRQFVVDEDRVFLLSFEVLLFDLFDLLGCRATCNQNRAEPNKSTNAIAIRLLRTNQINQPSDMRLLRDVFSCGCICSFCLCLFHVCRFIVFEHFSLSIPIFSFLYSFDFFNLFVIFGCHYFKSYLTTKSTWVNCCQICTV